MGLIKNIKNSNIPGPTPEHDFCEDCFIKQQKIDKLEARVKTLEAQLNYRKKKENGLFFGSSTPSSKIPVKKNTKEENNLKQGGAKKGHKGHGRKSFSEDEADEIIDLIIDCNKCPECGGKLEEPEILFRSVIDSILMKAKKILYRYQERRCSKCKSVFENKPLIIPRHMYGNNLIAQSGILHYLHGVPIKRIESMWGKNVTPGNLIKIFHRLAEYFKPAVEKLKTEYQKSPVKHADETGWRNNGNSGYAWIFCTENTSIFSFNNTRSSSVAETYLGKEKLPGVLVVDRYGGYNRSPCKIQYCYAHLLRTLTDLETKNPKNEEVQIFVSSLATLLSKAMKLRSEDITDTQYYRRAKSLKRKIQKLIRAPAEHLDIHNFQDIFLDNSFRLYHWVDDRRVPADNNRAERDLRPVVISRKVSFGSQSDRGADTRSILMTVIHTVAKRLKDKSSLEDWIVGALEKYIENPNVDPYKLIPKPLQSAKT